MSVLQDAFDNSPVLTSDDVPDNTPLPSQRDKSLYSNHDERAGIQQMPMYIREGDIRYSTTAPVQKAGDINYFGGGGGDAHCEEPIGDLRNGGNASGILYMLQNVEEQGSSSLTFIYAMVRFEDGCITGVYPEWESLTFSRRDITTCGGNTAPFTRWPIGFGGLEEDLWGSL